MSPAAAAPAGVAPVARTTPAGASRAETRERTQAAPPWNVVVHNDPVNLMTYVTLVFQKVFGYPRERAERHMMEVHVQGRSILWTGEFERAEGYLRELHGAQLLATLERAG